MSGQISSAHNPWKIYSEEVYSDTFMPEAVKPITNALTLTSVGTVLETRSVAGSSATYRRPEEVSNNGHLHWSSGMAAHRFSSVLGTLCVDNSHVLL
ncbi:hypothetical protein RvY_10991 [Ramazzottius varieornatus]|uniref:Uncharacterized protein n=1 Tax=Ramazzottius varieornatus TaxID=947166 RepID=A0A1D1VMF6_RAMVA|nr:hypothetical protein RvY_10991 [Ramazzottius varieornatus]